MTRLAALTSGPSRMRSDLRAATRRARALPAASAPLADVATALPPALFGGELLDVLSERLRALLAPAAQDAVVAAPSARSRGAHAPLAPPFAAGSAGHEPADVAARSNGAANGLRPPPLAPGGAEAGVSDLPARDGFETAPPEWGAAAARRRFVAGSGPLAERVRRYWQGVDADRSRARGRDGDGDFPSMPGRPAAAELDPGAAGAARATLADAEVASALGAFVAGEPFGPALATPAAAARAGFGERVLGGTADAPAAGHGLLPAADAVSASAPETAWPRAGAAGGAPSRAAALRGLADDVAEIIREQAIRHGIDVP